MGSSGQGDPNLFNPPIVDNNSINIFRFIFHSYKAAVMITLLMEVICKLQVVNFFLDFLSRESTHKFVR